jgi:predicted AlkP superfamily phosphohydrolase/phosphomutase
MTTKTLFIGLDGASFSILDELIKNNKEQKAVMPFLAKLYQNGTRCILRSTPNPLTPPAWVSLMTGRTPGNHGIYDFIRAEEIEDDVFFTLYDSRDCIAETIWSIASRQGNKVAALNFPFTAPPRRDIRGFVIPGFIPWRHLRRNTLPKELYDQLKEKLPEFKPKELAWDFEQEKEAINKLSDEDREKWVQYHLPREKQWFQIAEYLLRTEAPELMATMFDGVDKLQHQAWLFLDPDLQTGDESTYHHRMRTLCLDYFRQLDGFLEQLVTGAGPDVQVFLASDHGFTKTTEIVRINAYLHEKGYLHWKVMPDSDAARRREESMFANLDWTKTTAYCRTPSSNGITIRVADKEGKTGINPKDYEAFRDRLITDLKDLRDKITGERIITQIHKREDVFPGSAMDEAPDLLMVLRDHGFVSIKNKLPVVESREEIAGTHHPDGVFLAYGPGIKQNEVIDVCNITDVGATLLYSLGLDVPIDFDGKVPEAMFTQSYLSRNPVRINGSTLSNLIQEDSESMDDEEKQKLMAQLQLLGYMA